MKPSEALKLARANLAAKNSWYFICNALLEVDTPGAHEAAAHISRLLKPYRTYGTWLEHHHPELRQKYFSIPGAQTDARLCWIDDMIKYWEAKGC